MAPPWHPRDTRLVMRARGGDVRAFEQIYVRYAPLLLSFCRHLTGQREDAEDAVQHTFMAAHSRIADSDEPLDLRPWLFTVARNRSISLLRKRGVGNDAAMDPSEVAIDGLAAEVERREELRQLVRDLARLPEPQRAALLLAQLDALPYREIAHVLGVEPEKVKALVFQARSSLASTREAREAPCTDIRNQIATAHGPSLRRRTLRRHVRECPGCRDFETAVLSQRRALDALLPVVPTAGLAKAILEIAERGGGAGSGGAVAASTVGGGAAGGGVAGSLGMIGGSGIAKLALVGVIVGGSTGGAVAADLPERLATGSLLERVDPGPVAPHPHGVVPLVGGASPETPREGSSEAVDGKSRRAPDKEGPVGAAPAEPAHGSGEGEGDRSAEPEETAGLPPGLAKKDELPPGLAKKEGAPPGQEMKGGAPPGQEKQAGGDGGGQGGGNGQGQGQGEGQGQGQGSAGGQSNGGGNGQGQGNGNGGGNGNGNGGGNGH